ncbi:enterochelin esterase [Rhodococcus sp. HNM0569]|uniref:enterochelin esterase n=1 Tax=Rhodococcus sp. HNM0569 TaxID=2716340 RepID=UPI00146B6997|nr:enterochelin esterase [Rhodococcus sp. HNM0569]NLU83470.1 enterochelin esterase [Rhodococcus sp. HNM0569]
MSESGGDEVADNAAPGRQRARRVRVPGPERRTATSPLIASLDASDPDGIRRTIAATGGPIAEPSDRPDSVFATFCWWDPDGDESTSSTRCVYLDANGITDRARPERAALTRLPSTPLWHVSIEVPARWRGAYRFLPRRDELAPPASGGPGWQWWRDVLSAAVVDPFNSDRLARAEWPGSVAAMPAAPEQRWWTPSVGQGRLWREQWTLAGIDRAVWLYEPAGAQVTADRPVAILFDGRTWAVENPILAGLDRVAAHVGTSPLVVMIDSVDTDVRMRELGCDDRFAHAVTDELLPALRRRFGVTADPARTVVAGSSLGGLAAAYLTATRPDDIGVGVSLSGSFWWPGNGPGGSFQQVVKGGTGRFFLAPGELEWMLLDENREVDTLLRAHGHDVHYAEFCGGHDVVQWREQILAGLAWALAPVRETGVPGLAKYSRATEEHVGG